MKPLTSLPGDIRVLCTDIDDTLTTEGKLTAAAYSALERAHASGLTVVAVTGRPAGWADHIARMWPVDGVVAENGALYMRYIDGRMVRESIGTDARERLDAVAKDVLAQVPGAALASDQPYREFDLAIDFCEDVEPLSREDIQKIVDVFAAHGATTKVSSIHVNGWFGDYDKLGMLRRLLAEQFDVDIDDPAQRAGVLYVGDSPNDQPMFAFFENSVGVANVKDFEDLLESPPHFVTDGRAGAGFVELVDRLI